MRRIHRTIDIKAPVQRVYEFINQPSNLPGVWPHMVSVSNIVPREGGASDFDWVFKMGGVHFNGHAFVEQARPGEYARIRTEGGIPSLFVWSYTGLDGSGTRLTVDVEYSLPTPVIGKIAEALLTKSNERDLDDIPEEVRKEIEFIFVDTVDEVLRHALRDGSEQRAQPEAARAERTVLN